MGSPLNQEQEMLVQEEDLKNLVSVFTNSAFDNVANDPEKLREFAEIQQKSALLLAKDYSVRVIDDSGSFKSICTEKIVPFVLPSSGTGHETAESDVHEQYTESSEHTENMSWTRARTRFAVPVMYYGNKHICRLATLPAGLETHWRAIIDFFGAPGDYCAQVCRSMTTDTWEKEVKEELETKKFERDSSPGEGPLAMGIQATSRNGPPEANEAFRDALLQGELRREDILLLEELSVHGIVDLTAEESGRYEWPRGKLNRWMMYDDLYIFKLPYPGCDFFEQCKAHYSSHEDLVYGWGERFQAFDLQLHNYSFAYLRIDWQQHYAWDLVRLTKNYLRYLVKLVLESTASLLVHCISGWDRSPLFISLLRLSLWADGAIHNGLSPLEMAYLTVSYDWFLFCHDLPNRAHKTEEIFFFCLHMLNVIHAEAFSIVGLADQTDRLGSADVRPAESPAHAQECQFDISPSSKSSSSFSSFGPDGPPKYFQVPSSSDDEGTKKWSPPPHGPRRAAFMSQKKSSVADAIIASAVAVTAMADVALGHRRGEPSAAPKNPSPLLPTERPASDDPPASEGSIGNADQSTGVTDKTLSRPQLLRRRRERLTEVNRLVTSAYRCILEGHASASERSSYWARSLFSDTSASCSK